jgi:hypothetical protein
MESTLKDYIHNFTVYTSKEKLNTKDPYLQFVD